jgi:polar amino acid transport system substrate-binding protein
VSSAFVWLLALMLPSFSFAQESTKASIQESHQDPSIVSVCGHPVYPPISWIEGKSLHGMAPTMVKDIFEALGYQVDLRQDENWERCLKEAEKGHVDIVSSLFKLPEREAYLYFSEPLVQEPILLFFNKDNPVTWTEWSDLKGKSVGVMFGDSFGEEADRMINKYMEYEPVSSGQQNFGKLALGRIDLMPLGIFGGPLQARKYGYLDQIDYIDKPFVNEYWYMGISRKSPLAKRLPQVNEQIRKARESGKIKRLMAQFSDEFIESNAKLKGDSNAVDSAVLDRR